VLATFGYDQLGRRSSLTRGNGTVTGYTPDAVSRLQQLSQDLPGTGNDLTLGFAYNPAGQIASTTRSNDLYAWTGHGLGTTSTTSNGRNQIAGWVNMLGYDSKGNVTGDGTYAYGYSSENLLTSLTNSASGAIQNSSTYSYDPLMRLAVIDSSNAALDADLGYDGQEIVLEGLSSARTRRYVFGPGTDEPLVAYLVTTTGTTRSWLHADERGSTLRQTDDSGNPSTAVGRYDEYGAGLGVSRFQYTGQYWLGDAGLHYYRARVYDPKLGRFLQPDPIGYGGGMNLYAYVKGDPVNFTDPLGLQAGDNSDPCEGMERLNCGVVLGPGGSGSGGGAGLGSGAAGMFMVDMVGDGGGTGGPLEPIGDDPEMIICQRVVAKATGVGPKQANGSAKTSISQTPGRDIPVGSVAIDPTDFGVPDATGARREVFEHIIIFPDWATAVPPNQVSPAIPKGLPSRGPYSVVDVIGPASARNKPGFQIDLYRYTSQKDALASTRMIQVVPAIPINNLGVTCPTGN
jgi:RHS repeat-associated protein